MVVSSDQSADLIEITPTSLTHGFGIQVCNVLNSLSNAAIEKITAELSNASNNRIYPTIIDDPIDVDSEDEKDNIEEVNLIFCARSFPYLGPSFMMLYRYRIS